MSFGGKIHTKKGASWRAQRTIVPKEERTSNDGITHRTRAECKRWNQLRLLEQAGHIRNLRREVRYKLEANNIAIKSRKGNIRTYTADFVYEKRFTLNTLRQNSCDPMAEYAHPIAFLDDAGAIWAEIIEDIKGFLDPAQELRMDVFEALYGRRIFINKV